jgi:glycosyltransferase involved in cell wall biosynthesis
VDRDGDGGAGRETFMKIAYLIASSGLSGGTKVVCQQAEELSRRGHRVTVVSPDPRPEWLPLRRASYEESPFDRSRALAESDAAIATFWTTLEPVARFARGLVFHLCQGLETDTAFYAAKRSEIEAAYRLVPRKIVVSPHVGGFLERRGYVDVVDVGQAFDAEEFRVDARTFDRDRLRILLPGIFEIDVKGVGEALAALRESRERGARFRLLRVSSEPISAEERKWGTADAYHRAVPPGRMPALLAHADVFLGPNHEVEGFGLPSLEALAAGLPAALSDTPSHRAIAGDSAVFFAPRDTEGIIEAVGRLLQEPETRRRLSAEGPVRARRFRTSDVADRLEAILATEGNGAHA